MPDDVKTPSTSPEVTEPRLPLARHRLTFRARDHITLPPFQGKLWRSVFGLALKELSERAAVEGREAAGQFYRNFFEMPARPNAGLRCSKDPPRPYVIAAEANSEPWRFAPGQRLSLELTLIGRGADTTPAILEAFAHAAASGLGETRGRAELTAARQLHPYPRAQPREHPFGAAALPLGGEETCIPSVPAPPESPVVPPPPGLAEIRLITPLRLVRDNRLIAPETLRAEHLLTSLVQRISNLMILYAGDDWKPAAPLRRLAGRAVMLEPRLKFQDQSRWSARQQAEMPMGGIMGSFILDMRELAPFWPYLWLGQWVHAGKGAVMGLGALRIAGVHRS